MSGAYAAVEIGSLGAVWGSTGFLELFARNGSAAALLQADALRVGLGLVGAGALVPGGMEVPGGIASAVASPGGVVVTVFHSPEMPGR